MIKKKKKILVVLGGNSKERTVSLDSGKACFDAVKRLGYKVKNLNLTDKTYIRCLQISLINIYIVNGRKQIFLIIFF